MNRQENTIFFPEDIEQTGYSNSIFISQNRLGGFSLFAIFLLMLVMAFNKQLLVNMTVFIIVILLLLGLLAFIFLKFVLNEKQLREVLVRNNQVVNKDISPFWEIHSYDSQKKLLKYNDLTHKAIIRIISSSKTAQATNFEDYSRKRLGEVLDFIGTKKCEIDLTISSQPYYREKPFTKLNKLINEETNETVKAITRYIFKQIQTTAQLYADVQILELEVYSSDQRNIEFLSNLESFLKEKLDRTLYSNIKQLDLDEVKTYLAISAGLTGVAFEELNKTNIKNVGVFKGELGWVINRYDSEGYEIFVEEEVKGVVF